MDDGQYADLRQEKLRRQHAALEADITAEQSRRGPDSPKLKELKLRKLRIKEELEGITVVCPNRHTEAIAA